MLLASEMSPRSTSPNREYFDRWRNREFAVLFSEDTFLEYVKKLREKRVPEETIRKLLGTLLEIGVEVHIRYYHLPAYPVDADDIAFLLCAENGDATHLVTYDRHLRAVSDHYSFTVCNTPEFLADLRQRLAASS